MASACVKNSPEASLRTISTPDARLCKDRTTRVAPFSSGFIERMPAEGNLTQIKPLNAIDS